MPRYAPKMTNNDLRQILFDLAIKNDYEEEYDDIDKTNPDLERIIFMLLGEELLPAVEKDWEKVNFSWENLHVTAEKTTQDGIPYFELEVGGDWETSFSTIIYFDGKKFRGFIPKNGNAYNHKSKSAFGNNADDVEQAKKQFGQHLDLEENYIDVTSDITKITAEINSRLEAKGTYTPGTKTPVSNATLKKKKQAEIEKNQDLTGDITADMVYAIINLAAGASYVSFELRSSRRTLTVDECDRLIGVPSKLEKTKMFSDDSTLLWYSPMGYYPLQTQKLLEDAGFEKAPDNDISHYAGAKTIYINL